MSLPTVKKFVVEEVSEIWLPDVMGTHHRHYKYKVRGDNNELLEIVLREGEEDKLDDVIRSSWLARKLKGLGKVVEVIEE